jgi:hypothetical protein
MSNTARAKSNKFISASDSSIPHLTFNVSGATIMLTLTNRGDYA